MELKTSICGNGSIPISTLIEQCNGINVESVSMDCRGDGLTIVGTLVPRSLDPSRLYKKIIINPPATIVIWNNGTKTVVKATENDIYDPEKGVALCFFKKYFGSSYRKVLKDANDIYKKKLEEDAELNNSLNGASLLKGFTVSLTEVTNKARKLILGDEKKEDGGNE